MEMFAFNGTYQLGTIVIYSPAKQGGWVKLDNPEVRRAIYAWRTALVESGIEKKAGEDVLFHITNVIVPGGNGNGNKFSPKNGTRVRCCVRVHLGQPENLRQRIVGNPVEVIAQPP